MKSTDNPIPIAGLIAGFFILVFAISFVVYRDHPVYAIAGEASVATWMSGVLLVMASSFCMLTSTRRSFLLWGGISVFFLVLAIDERFMFHEQSKEFLVFSYYGTGKPVIFYELPVVAGAVIGAGVSFLLWKQFDHLNRMLLGLAAALGTVSVTIDILDAGVVLEEISKLIAELMIVLSLLRKASEN